MTTWEDEFATAAAAVGSSRSIAVREWNVTARFGRAGRTDGGGSEGECWEEEEEEEWGGDEGRGRLMGHRCLILLVARGGCCTKMAKKNDFWKLILEVFFLSLYYRACMEQRNRDSVVW